jgi:tetratricopeptide (TPR) repeat protein
LRILPLLAAAVLWAGTALADAVQVKGAPHEGYGRLVFNWDLPVRYSATVKGNLLTVAFARPIEASYAGAVRSLSKYVTAAKPGGDKKSVVFTLTGPFTVRSFDSGATIVVDITGEAPKAEPKPAPRAEAKPAAKSPAPAADSAAGTEPGADLPPLKVRVGEHKDYTRVVFDWPRAVDYGVAETEDGPVIIFALGARPDLSRFRKDPPPFIKEARAEMKGKRLAVSLSAVPGATVKHFTSGNSVVIDIGRPTPESLAKAKEKTTTPAPAPAAETAEAAKPTALAPPPPGAAPKPETPPPPPAPPAPTTQATPPPPAPPPPPPSAAGTAPTGAVSLRFDWTEPVAAAVFRRAGAVWVVFDRAVQIAPDILKRAAGNAVRDVSQVPSKDGTILRFETVAGINAIPRRDGLAWIIDLARVDMKPATRVDLKAQPDSPVGARIFVPVPEPGKAIPVVDPEAGDNIVVIPVIPLGHGIDQAWVYPQLAVLPTAQGVVIKPWVDDLRIRPLRQGIEVTSAGGKLALSKVSDAAAAGGKLAATTSLSKVFDFEKWRRGTPQTVTYEWQKFMHAVATANGAIARDQARLDLARYLLSAGLAAEALGVLDLMDAQRPDLLSQAEHRALKGAASFLMARWEDARDYLTHPSLQGNDEATLWLAAAQGASGDMAGAAMELVRTGALIRTYPKPLKMAVGLLVAEGAIETGDLKTAQQYLEVLQKEELTIIDQVRLDLVDGRLKEVAGDFDQAVTLWEGVIESVHPPSEAKAVVARGELLYKLDKIERADLIKDLETLRFAWRGDDFEFGLLRRMGTLYIEEGDYREGLRTLKQAATYFRQHPDAPLVTQQMADAFAKLYLENGADSLPPVTAIALYDEFKELTPAGPRGDEMIRKLADRLVGVDLLDQGAALLEQQVRFRLQGELRGRVGTRLALVRLLNREPEKALEALKESNGTGLPQELIDQRRHLEARIMMQMGRHEDALALLKTDKSEAADRLRADIFWDLRNWPDAAQAYRKLLEDTKLQPRRPVTEEQARFLLNLGIALTLSNNERGIAKLRQDHLAAMDNTPLKDAFRLISRPPAEGLIDYQTIAGRVSEATNFQAFLNAYKAKLGQGNLSGIN